MRLWTVHPKYLDRQGLLAVWREGLLAQAVLQGKTKGYKNHPQLERFNTHPQPQQAIAFFLHEVHQEATRRGYDFDGKKYKLGEEVLAQIETTSGQLDFEVEHLLRKLKQRSKDVFDSVVGFGHFDPHPLFVIVPGEVENWEKVGAR